MMQEKYSQTDSDIFLQEQIIQKISPDSSSHFKPECLCGCHLLADYSQKSFVMIPLKQNGTIVDIVKLPIFKIKPPKKSLMGYAKCKMVSFNRKNLDYHFPIPMWSIQKTDLAASLACQENQDFIQTRSNLACQTESSIEHGLFKQRANSNLQAAGTSQNLPPVNEETSEDPEEETGRISYEDYRTGFGQWYPFFINKPVTRRRRQESSLHLNFK